jgi:hypothetical protein
MPEISHDDSLYITQNINAIIRATGINTNNISDGYHTFGELYEHRILLFIALCKIINKDPQYQNSDYAVWKSKRDSDGSERDGWFLLGIGYENGSQITYHLPLSKWDECFFAAELRSAPDWDGHTSVEVLERLKLL